MDFPRQDVCEASDFNPSPGEIEGTIAAHVDQLDLPRERPAGRSGASSVAAAHLTTIVVPVLNEEQFIAPCLQSIIAQIEPGEAEIFVADGGSTDRTAEIVAEISRRHPCIKMIDNPRRLQSAAVNLVATIASPCSRVLVRADAHALYPPDFLRNCLRALDDNNATSVVVPMRTVGHEGFQRAVAAAQNSKLGNGGSAHRSGGVSRWVDHGHHAVFDREFFMRTGGYDESFTHNEDAEFDHRGIQAGGRIWLATDAVITYFPRGRPWRLAKQYFSHGKGRARTLITHGLKPRPRQIAPMLILAMTACALFSPLNPWAALPILLYLAICTTWAVATAAKQRDPWLLLMGVAATIMHISWGSGFLASCYTHLRSGYRRTTHPALVPDPSIHDPSMPNPSLPNASEAHDTEIDALRFHHHV